MLVLAIVAMFTALGIMACAVFTSLDQRSSRGQLPPWPGPGSHALDGERHGSTGHGPVPPGPRDDQTRADSRTHKPNVSPSLVTLGIAGLAAVQGRRPWGREFVLNREKDFVRFANEDRGLRRSA